MIFNLKMNSELYDRFVVSYLGIPNFIENAELASLYKIFEFCSMFAIFTIWNPFFFFTSGLFTGLTRLNSFSNVLPVYLTHNFRPLKLSAAEFTQRTISAFPLLIELAITALMVLVVGHFVCSRLICSDSCASSTLPANGEAEAATKPSPSEDLLAGAGKHKTAMAAQQNPQTAETKKSKQSKPQSKRSN